ncbi:MAG: hypothetical protein VCA34_07160, partial [Roseibacillus sp.]
VVIRAGGQHYNIDGGGDGWSPYVEATVRTALSEAASVRAFVRYGIEDRNRSIPTHDCAGPQVLGVYEERKVSRLGAQGSYVVSPKLTAFAGVNVVLIEYDSEVGLGNPFLGLEAPGSLSDAIVNFNIGASYEVLDNLFVTGSYNYSNSSSDADIRDYDRHRVQMGVQSAF